MDNKIELLKTTSEYILNLKYSIEQIIEYLQNDKEAKGLSLIGDVANNLSLLFEAIDSTKDYQKQEISIEELNEKLNEIVEAMENGDTILIGDLFQYELLPILDNIQEIIKKSIK
ncbi:hypothetical protein KQI89_04870 [Clostridium sp. MSJ-4]|uniref:DUF8042 domain-containing protein n=1 Tax=Clostridium simiarum TaxID=2841506 RepID=A0ABS6EXY9_9CLOT|nr:hypothetical protein [Clostridium simiarum]MBU5591088.1 hypothetical protein [Clostridium simiarum]